MSAKPFSIGNAEAASGNGLMNASVCLRALTEFSLIVGSAGSHPVVPVRFPLVIHKDL